MEITEVKVFMREGQDKKLKAYATLTFDNVFVVRNVKVIEGTKGLFVAMPSRKVKEPCPKCSFRNVIRSKYCNNCGLGLPMTEHKAPAAGAEGSARESEHKDIAHPITAECRDYIQKKVLEAFDREKKSPPAPASGSSARSDRPASHAAPRGDAPKAPVTPVTPVAPVAPVTPVTPPAPMTLDDEDIEL